MPLDPHAEARQRIARVRGRAVPRDELAHQAVELATVLLRLARRLQTPEEAARAELLARMMGDSRGRALTLAFTDRAHRAHDPRKAVSEVCWLLDRYGAPQYLPAVDRMQLHLLRALGPLVPGLSAAAVRRRIRGDTSPYLIPGDWAGLSHFLAERRKAGVRVNVNRLGEEVLGEAEALRHVESYVELAQRPDVEAISVKISSIHGHIDVFAWRDTLATLQERLRRIYRAAMTSPISATDARTPKLVYLDMESYRDLELNLQLFQSVLSEDEFLGLSAGVVLQAYIPESAAHQRKLLDWARQRVERGGACIRLRIAKGANLGMEQVESSLRGWPSPTYDHKAEVDANYKRMVELGCNPAHAPAVHLGIASHNLFDLAYAALLRASHQVEEFVGFELLEGMANPICRALSGVAGNVLVYGPMVTEHDFQSAIAYLVRRFDESTAEENFLRSSFHLTPEGAEFGREQQKFLAACSAIEQVSERPKRTQDRAAEALDLPASAPFRNEPDTDFSRACNRTWIAAALEQWRPRTLDLPLHIGGAEIFREPFAAGFDPSRPGHLPYRYSLATQEDIDRALSAAQSGQREWAACPLEQRCDLLIQVARGLRRARGELIACMVLDAGKRVEEADIEVSEAIDFAEYYARSLAALGAPTLALTPRGVTVVTPPWNFPLAIPVGGVLAAIAAGNSAVLKPAPETVLVAERAARVLWQAGVPAQVLQFLTASDSEASQLITDPRVAAVILTGATATAQLFRSLRPRLHLCAETGGKNAIIVTAQADRELAIRDTVSSAFGHAGQKCSAASLLILEAEVYDDPGFRKKLLDATQSLPVGSAWDPKSFVTPLIRIPDGNLHRAFTQLDADETWLIEPKVSNHNPQLYSPGIKFGVREGSFSHFTEFFGPVLSVLRARDWDHALQLANGTPYGLTAGLHSLDEREQAHFTNQMDAGNLYINRSITGAIVGRQPFGGRKASSYGPGAKAGGPNYVLQLMRANPSARSSPADDDAALDPSIAHWLVSLSRALSPDDAQQLGVAARSYTRAYNDHFRDPQSPFRLLGQNNSLRYDACPVLIRCDEGATALDVARSLLAARICTMTKARVVPLHLSVAKGIAMQLAVVSLDTRVVVAPSEIDALATYLDDNQIVRIRALGQPPDNLYALTASNPLHIANDPVTPHGRIELLHYLREQSLSVNTHRYGNLALQETFQASSPPPIDRSPGRAKGLATAR